MTIGLHYHGRLRANDSTAINPAFAASPHRYLVLATTKRGTANYRAGRVGEVDAATRSKVSDELGFGAIVTAIPIPSESSIDIETINFSGVTWVTMQIYELSGVGGVHDTAVSDTAAVSINTVDGGLVLGVAANAEGENGYTNDGQWFGLANERREISKANGDVGTSANSATNGTPLTIQRTTLRSQFAAMAAVAFAPVQAVNFARLHKVIQHHHRQITA